MLSATQEIGNMYVQKLFWDIELLRILAVAGTDVNLRSVNSY